VSTGVYASDRFLALSAMEAAQLIDGLRQATSPGGPLATERFGIAAGGTNIIGAGLPAGPMAAVLTDSSLSFWVPYGPDAHRPAAVLAFSDLRWMSSSRDGAGHTATLCWYDSTVQLRVAPYEGELIEQLRRLLNGADPSFQGHPVSAGDVASISLDFVSFALKIAIVAVVIAALVYRHSSAGVQRCNLVALADNLGRSGDVPLVDRLLCLVP
jgi:hypothetical protein